MRIQKRDRRATAPQIAAFFNAGILTAISMLAVQCTIIGAWCFGTEGPFMYCMLLSINYLGSSTQNRHWTADN